MLDFTLIKNFSTIESIITEEDWNSIFYNNKSIVSQEYYNFYYSYGNSWKPKSILEIGVRFGYSAVSLAIGAGDSLQKFVGIDSEIDVDSSSNIARNNLQTYTQAEVQLFNFDTQKDNIPNDIGTFDLIHIDADHTFYGCINDILLSLSLAKVGTKIIVDDCLYAPVRAAVEAIIKIHHTKLNFKYVTNFRGHGLIETLESFPELTSKEKRYEIINQIESPFTKVIFSSIANNYSKIISQIDQQECLKNNHLPNHFLDAITQIKVQADLYLEEAIQKIKLALTFYQNNGFNVEGIFKTLDSIQLGENKKNNTSKSFVKKIFVKDNYIQDINICKEIYGNLYLLNIIRLQLVNSSVGKFFTYFCRESTKHFDYLAVRIDQKHNSSHLPKQIIRFKSTIRSKNNISVTYEGYLLSIVLTDALINILSCFEGELESQYWNLTQKQDNLMADKLKSCPRRLEIGSIFDPANHYTEEYYNGLGLEYMTPNGGWDIYYGPSTTWDGFYLVVEILEQILTNHQERKLLDVGCSYGDFVHKAVQKGWDAYGVDISSKAVEKSHPEVRNRIICADIVRPNETLTKQAPFDVITTWDFWEHIYESDLDKLLDGVFTLLRPGGVMFNIICTSAKDEPDFVVQKGEVFTKENSSKLCSGHITIHKWSWWVQKFLAHGFEVDYNLAYLFQVACAEDDLSGFANLVSWSPRNLLVLRKPC